ncbi:PspA/IM30 family protein [Thiocystis minor]|uniref:PspA/IM30 family protein n=1 Tax=Thiocystis minor TaxID=61597 RepID=UPI0019137EA6|nr:PspA/IM30 family protein [Thiocystis minor]
MARLTRLFRADLHALLDRLESPDLVLAQAVREMEQALAQEQRTLIRLERDIDRLASQDAELQRRLTQTGEAVDDCLVAGRDDLARPVIRRRLETERQSAALHRRRLALETEREQRVNRLAEQTARLADLRAQAALYEEEEETELGGATESWSHAEPGVREADVEVALLQAKRQRGMTS